MMATGYFDKNFGGRNESGPSLVWGGGQTGLGPLEPLGSVHTTQT